MNCLIVLPSYNERDNICRLVETILNVHPNYYVCVVDDNSPDGTPLELNKYLDSLGPDKKPRLHIIIRSKKDGRGGAVRDGIFWGLSSDKNFDVLIEMDCDFSHPPEDLPRGVELLKNADVVMGSRYPNGTIVGWPLLRRVFSFFANILARILIDWGVADYTNGFRFYNRRAAEFMSSKEQKHKGYIYLSETISYFLKEGFIIKSFPILFVNRRRGQSNTGFREVYNALKGIFMIAWSYRFGSP